MKEAKTFDIEDYLQKLIGACKNSFRERLLYVGLQGSYMRGEATEKSDIDVMVLLEDFSAADLDAYRDILKKIGAYETSILPYEDCCTIFVAKHPVTKPKLDRIVRSERKLEGVIEELYREALDTVEVIEI